ncbi:hypothetical protein ACFQO4_10895 [Saliphagus sp. GCM10025334]
MTEPNDVLIQTTRAALEHKMKGEVKPGHLPFWRVNGTPRRTDEGASILFSDGQRVIARGLVAKLEEGRIWFTPLEAVDEVLPAEPPTRGFKYVDPSGVPA